MMDTVEFSTNRVAALHAATRYEKMMGRDLPADYRRDFLLMDLGAADGVNGNPPLDWDRLLEADDFNFLHDLEGISRHMDRSTGRLGDCFVPRFTR